MDTCSQMFSYLDIIVSVQAVTQPREPNKHKSAKQCGFNVDFIVHVLPPPYVHLYASYPLAYHVYSPFLPFNVSFKKYIFKHKW